MIAKRSSPFCLLPFAFCLLSFSLDAAPLELTLKQAVDLALAPDGNTRVQLARQFVRQAEERSVQARAALLPNLDAAIGQQNLTRNLDAFGIRIEAPIPGFRVPELVGPFNVFDARASVTQTIFDFSAIRRYQASRSNIKAVDAEAEAARDEVAHGVAGLYLGALRAEARVQTAKANVALAEELVELAANQKAAGTGTGIEITRARVQLANERQQLLVAENERRQARLTLLKTIGLPLATEIRFAEQLSYIPVEPVPPEKALAGALETRADWLAQRRREETARLNYSAAKMERLPSVVGFADYGSIGSSIHNAVPTRAYGLSARVPVFDGGRRDARRGESRSQLEQERIRTADLREQIELELKLALDGLESSGQQVKVAEEGLAQTEQELEQARRRYQAGVAPGLEVTDVQTRLARARENHIAALFLYNKARIDLAHATGAIQKALD